MSECPDCGGYNVRCYNESYPDAWLHCRDCGADWVETDDDDGTDGNGDDMPNGRH